MSYQFKATVEEAIDIIKKGGMIILTDDEDRENEGDIVAAAQFASPDVINFMATHARGLICLSLTSERCDELGLKQMVYDNSCKFKTAFTVSIEAREGVSTGISAADRAKTIKTAIDKNSKPSDLVSPGHVFPLRSKDGGVLVRAGQTEGSVDLARLAGLNPSGVICEIMNDDGTMARRPELIKFAEQHKLKIISIADIIKYRLNKEDIVELIPAANLPTIFGDFKIVGFRNTADSSEAVALIKGEIEKDTPTLTRVHSQCLTGDAFASKLCDCSNKLHEALEKINEEGSGVLLYMYIDTSKAGFLSTPEGNLNPHGAKEPELRDYGFGAMCLRKLGIKKIKLITSSPKIIKNISGYGIEIVE